MKTFPGYLRQFGGESPFSVLHDILKNMFSGVDGSDPQTEETVGHATARVDPTSVEEGEELRVLISIVAHKEELKNLKIRIDFGDAIRVDGERNALKYRQGPISHTSR